MAWGAVRRFMHQKAAAERGQGALFPEYAGNYGTGTGYSNRYRKERKNDRDVEWTHGCRTYHPATKEVVVKYHDRCNAVLILPDSWLDKKLQEAYLSKRGEAERKDSE